jgi:serine/threonine-protein kinase
MDAARWEHVQSLFEAALEKDPSEWKAFLREACGGDEEIYHEVYSLLKADDQTLSFLDGVALGAADLLEELSLEGQQVGPYRILQELGHGGMGAVYLAERADGQFQQRVALKLIKHGMDTRQIVRRFQAERQILARLQHENIARLLDGGVTEAGLPYFAMEYVDGEPIDQYCDSRRLSIEERLELFVTVCKAVLYAHSKLVVHRDLKPENILVSDEGTTGKPVVKLLDFGIAKVLEGEEEGLTQTGGRVMTPAYASPEQIRGEGVGTSTDIYSLGVVLYELLAGHRPYAARGRSPLEVARVMEEEEPKRPSTLLKQEDPTEETVTLASISRARRTHPERLRRKLEGDLDVICLKALRKEQERRYGSVDQFAADISRHLSGLPVLARPDTAGYRLRKFLLRHRTGVVATVVVLLMLGTLVTFYTLRLAEERDRARLEAEKADQVASYLQDIFVVADPSMTQGETVTARELLEEGARRIERELADQPGVQAEMMDVMGKVYQRMGLYPQAEPLLKQALALRQDLHGRQHPDLAVSLYDLGSYYRDVGEYEAAEPLYRQALEMQEALFGPEHADVAASLRSLASLYRQQGEYEAAEPLYRQALAMQQRLLGPEDERTTSTKNSLALLLDRMGAYDDAEALYREVLRIDRQRLGAEDPDVATVMSNLAYMLRRKRDYPAAESLYRETLAVQRKIHGEEHPNVANTMRFLGSLLRDMEHYEEAEALYRSALDMRLKLLGPEHPDIPNTMNSLALLLVRTGDFEGAEAMYRDVVKLFRQSLGDDHPHLAAGLNNLASVLRDKGDLDAASAHYEESLAILRAGLPEQHPELVYPLEGLAGVFLRQQHPDRAEPLLREVLAIRRANRPAGHRYIADAASELGRCLVQLERFDEGETLLLESLPVLTDQRGADHPQTRSTVEGLAELYERWGRTEQAAGYKAMLGG